jgi:hypothetical protein
MVDLYGRDLERTLIVYNMLRGNVGVRATLLT